MSVNLYDEMLLQKLNYWTEKTDVTVYNVEQSRRLIEVLADKTDDKKIKLPIIALRRPDGFTIKNTNKQPLSFDGLKVIKDDSAGVSLNAIPINIRYKLDVYTRLQKENDLYMRNLIFNIVNYPTFQIIFKYNNVPVEQYGNIYLENNVTVSSSDISLHSDQICKQTLNIYIDDAYLWDVRVKNNVYIDSGLKLAIKDKEDFIIEKIC